jgi:hypothetical protein
MRLDGKPEIAVVVNVEQEQRKSKTLEQIFNDLKIQSNEEAAKVVGADGQLNYNGRKHFLFPLLERNGITTWEELNIQANLIDERKSNLSSTPRNAVIHLHTHCLILKSKLDENNS